MAKGKTIFLCLSHRKLCAFLRAENTCITSLTELQSNKRETRNASRPGPVKNHRFGAGSVFDHINDHRPRRNTRKAWFQRCLKSNQNKLKIAKSHCKLPGIILTNCLTGFFFFTVSHRGSISTSRGFSLFSVCIISR